MPSTVFLTTAPALKKMGPPQHSDLAAALQQRQAPRQKLYGVPLLQPHHHHQQPRQQPQSTPNSPSSPSTTGSSGASTAAWSCSRCGFSPSSSAATSPLFTTGSAAPTADDGGSRALADARKQIDDLQAQVGLLNEKAMAAVEKWADYEDELVRLRGEVRRSQQQQQATPTVFSSPSSPGHQKARAPLTPSFLGAAAATARLSALWSAKSTPNLKAAATPGSSPPPTPQQQHQRAQSVGMTPDQTTDELLVALTREQHLRLTAEEKVLAASREVEELSVSLFEQANEMVAAERRARAKLEERVELLEKRDAEKRRRLERLESAIGRIERVKKLLDETPS